MKIAVIGATGKAGKLIANEATSRGYEVSIFVRDKSLVEEVYNNVIQKDIMDLRPADVKGYDAVISAYGCSPGQEEEQLGIMQHLIEVFEQVPEVRFLAVGGVGSLYTDETLSQRLCDNFPPSAKLPIFAAKAFDGLKKSKVNWTYFSPAMRFKYTGMRTGKYKLGCDSVIKNDGGESYISYADYAVAMVDELENKSFLKKRFTAVSERHCQPESVAEGRQRFITELNYGLSGKTLNLAMDDGNEYVICFLTEGKLMWAKRGDAFVYADYKCIKEMPEIYMLSFFADDEKGKICVTWVVDMGTSLVTLVEARVGLNSVRKNLVHQNIVFGAIKLNGVPLPVIRHGYTNELVGKKIAWQYSPAVKLTHIYLTERYVRSSLKDMPPIGENTTEEQIKEIKDRAKRWGGNFFEEECFYIKLREEQYLVGFIEDFRNRVNSATGGGDILFLINTVSMRDFTRSFDLKAAGGPKIMMGTAVGEFIEEQDDMETKTSPYRIQ